MHRLVLPLAVGLLLAALPAVAQRAPGPKPPIKWGDVPEAHLQMTRYDADTTAAAVVLADYADVYFDENFELIYDRHRRIKILSEAGYEWGTVLIPVHTRDGLQKISAVRGQTFTLDERGRVQRHKLGRKSIFTEDADGTLEHTRFTLPALAPGAVIEYSYRLRSRNPVLLEGWQFQTSEPTLYSEYRVEIPAGFEYVTAMRGGLSFSVQEEEPSPLKHFVRYRWVMEAVPALREEPFMTTPKNFRAAIEFQLKAVEHPRFGQIQFWSTWETVAKELLDLPSFGQLLGPTRRVRQAAEEQTAGLTDDEARLRALYDYVRTTIAWNEGMGFIADQDPDEVLRTQRASSPETAFLLVALLRAAGFEAHPLLVSTRSHGTVIEAYPLLSQFNDVLVWARAGGQEYVLDATDPLRPYDLLPTDVLSTRGFVVDERAPRWVTLDATGRAVEQVAVEAALAEDGTFTGTLQASNAGYSALDRRHAFRSMPEPTAFARTAYLGDLDDVTISSAEVMRADDVEAAFKTTAAFTAPGYAQTAGDFLYLNPVVLGRVGENPLRPATRTFPIDFAHPRQHIYTLRLRLPEGYTVEEVPRDIRLPLPLQGGHYLRAITHDGEMLTVQSQLLFSRAVFPPDVYRDLRAFYARLVASEADQIVLRRAEAAPSETGGNR